MIALIQIFALILLFATTSCSCCRAPAGSGTASSVRQPLVHPQVSGVKTGSAAQGAELTDPVSAELIVSVRPGSDLQALGRQHGLQVKRVLLSDRNMAVLVAESPVLATKAKAALAKNPAVVSVFFNLPSQNQPTPP